MKNLYEVNWHHNNGTLDRISVTPIKVLREGILPGCSEVSITAVDSNGHQFQGCPQDYFETEEAAWAQTKIELQEAIASEEQDIREAQRRIEGLRSVLSAIQGDEPAGVPRDAISVVGMPEFDALMDYIYEEGTSGEAVIRLANKLISAAIQSHMQHARNAQPGTALAKLASRHNNSPCVLTDSPSEFNDVALVRLSDYEALQAELEQWKKGSAIRDEQNEELHQYVLELKTEIENLRKAAEVSAQRPTTLKPLLNAVTAHIVRQYNLWKPYPIHDGYYHWATGYRDIFSWVMPDEMVDNLAGSGVTAEMDEMTIRCIIKLATEDDMATHRRPPALRRAAKHISDRLKAYQPDYMCDELFVQILSRWQAAYDSELRWVLRKGVDEALLESTIRLKLSMEAL